MYTQFWRGITILLLISQVTGPAAADETVVHVPKSWGAAVPVDLSGLRPSGAAGQVFVTTLRGDIRRSGWLALAGPGKGTVTVQGQAVTEGEGLDARCRVALSATQQVYFDRSYTAKRDAVRALAHRVCDEIVKAVAGKEGIAGTQILLVGLRGGNKEIYLCDADGGNLQQITRDHSVSLMPRWSPSGDGFVYTSFRGGFPDVYAVDLLSGQRNRIAKFSGVNIGATYMPGGEHIALTLSKDGNPELYTMHVSSKRLTRLTRTPSAGESSPSVSPDGRQIVFVSDSSGSPQLYVIGRSGGERRRITFRGRENVAPHWGPNGLIVFSSRRFGRYQLCTYDPRAGTEVQLTEEYVDHEDPAWAPNGRHVAYTRTEGHAANVYILDTATRASLPLLTLSGAWYTPSWSPR